MSGRGARSAAAPASAAAASPERQHVRYAHEAAIRVSFGTTRTQGRTRNVSRGGLCANVDQQIPVGTDVMVDMVLVFDGNVHSDALTLPARVAWCTVVDDAFQVGLSFRSVGGERADYLQTFLKYLGEERAPEQPRDRAKSIDDQFG